MDGYIHKNKIQISLKNDHDQLHYTGDDGVAAMYALVVDAQ